MKHTIGVLALQGAFAKHIDMLSELGARTVEVREPEDLANLDGLVIPGGESTTMSKMLVRWNLIEPLQSLINGGLPVYGTCAGLILLADELEEWNELPRPGGLHVKVARNAYGRQRDSFQTELKISVPGGENFDTPFAGVFIRAPRIMVDENGGGLGDGVSVLSSHEGIPILVRQKNILAGSFHPELTGDNRIHSWFLKDMVGSSGSR